jgi:hypothetical protein
MCKTFIVVTFFNILCLHLFHGTGPTYAEKKKHHITYRNEVHVCNKKTETIQNKRDAFILL